MTRKKAEEKAPELTVFDRLAEPFPPDCVEWRAQTVGRDGKQAMALAYIDARSVMARLDETVGPANWQDRYRYEGNRTFCELELRIEGEWLTKSDTSGDTNFEGEKGGASGAFKRAAVKWGVGRYLYDVDAIWADCEAYEDTRQGSGAKKKWVFKKWTQAGERALAGALAKAPGPRATGRPFAVDKMLELIRNAKSVGELTKVRELHLATIPLEYRKEVVEAGRVKRQTLQAKETEGQDDGRSEQGNSRRQSRRGPGGAEHEQRRGGGDLPGGDERDMEGS